MAGAEMTGKTKTHKYRCMGREKRPRRYEENI